jgi:hypothetical protein
MTLLALRNAGTRSACDDTLSGNDAARNFPALFAGLVGAF